MPNVLILLAHPEPTSFNAALADAYRRAASSAGADVELISLTTLDFDPVLRHGLDTKPELEPDLVRARAAIERASHLVFVFPTYWASLPAVLRGFVDRTFLPGWAFRYDGGALPTGLLRGRSARIVTTMDSPWFWYRFVHHRSVHAQLGKATLDYCGVGPIAETTVYETRKLGAEARAKVIARLEAQAKQDVARLRARPAQEGDRVMEKGF
jgi:NAD(P)H dehydrogenase (quinone)